MPDYGKRANNAGMKARGYFGELPLPDGSVATEYSVNINLDGRDVEIPTLTPNLTKDELKMMTQDIIPNRKDIPESIIRKAAEHAKQRLRAGKSPFATEDDAPLKASKLLAPKRSATELLR